MISVIIPTYNRAILLRKALQSIIRQTLSKKEFEVIVIDNNSTDGTAEIVNQYSYNWNNLKYFHESSFGLHAARHRGLNESAGEILVFADDDIEAFPSWLEGIKESFMNNNVALVGGKNISLYESDPPDWLRKLWISVEGGRYLPDFSLLDFGDTIKEVEPYFIFGCNFSIRKKILFEIKGFHPDGMPQNLLKYRGDGETFVAKQVKNLGYTILYNPKASVNHFVPTSRMSLEYIKKRAFSEGVSGSYIDTRKTKLNNEKTGFIKKVKGRIKILLSKGLRRTISIAYQEGYKFHQRELKKDKNLLEWVLKDNYLTE